MRLDGITDSMDMSLGTNSLFFLSHRTLFCMRQQGARFYGVSRGSCVIPLAIDTLFKQKAESFILFLWLF